MPEAERVVVQRTLGGLLPAGNAEGATRRLAYDQPPLGVITRLALGEKATIPTTETSSFGGEVTTIAVPTIVKYETCGAVRVGGEVWPVKVYRVSTAGRSYRLGQPDSVRRSSSAIYLSDATGYPLIYQGATTTVIESIRHRRSAGDRLT